MAVIKQGFALVVFLVSLAAAQANSPYAGEQNRDIKAIDAKGIADLLAGRGMGLAKSAELNSYPGPSHVLELGRELKLDPDQTMRIRASFERMQVAAIALGSEIVEKERVLDRRFAHQHIDEADLEKLTMEIAQLQGRLRNAHLRAHLEMKAILTPEQIAGYDRLRGYSAAASPTPDAPDPHKH